MPSDMSILSRHWLLSAVRRAEVDALLESYRPDLDNMACVEGGLWDQPNGVLNDANDLNAPFDPWIYE